MILEGERRHANVENGQMRTLSVVADALDFQNHEGSSERRQCNGEMAVEHPYFQRNE